MLALATSVARPNLVSLGTCFGKFSKTGKFKLGITCLDWLAKYAKYKVRLEIAFHLLYMTHRRARDSAGKGSGAARKWGKKMEERHS
jgi:60S ribosome subunit biogenesis protein NIP7